ncbi:MAG: hypothetical protein ACOYMN_23390 [Roseimicrobium sp.]
MPPSTTTRDKELTAELLNETILRAAAHVDADILAAEVTRRTAEITTWDESPETLGLRIPAMPPTPVMSIAEQLVTAGADEAESEKRQAAAHAQ